MTSGLNKDNMSKVLCIIDRENAIKTACMLAQSGDAVLVAGKGHENYQEIQGIKHHFDDKEVIEKIFKNE
jgi:UDP-N-acetylmuramoyl-L-alanyl-D-glutamate--2,6-diaminopimelate ligase